MFKITNVRKRVSEDHLMKITTVKVMLFALRQQEHSRTHNCLVLVTLIADIDNTNPFDTCSVLYSEIHAKVGS